MKFEKPSMGECKELVGRLKGKNADEIIDILGQPARETGARKEERLYDGVPKVVEISRTLTYYNVSQTVHRLIVVERIDSKCELKMSGQKIPDAPES